MSNTELELSTLLNGAVFEIELLVAPKQTIKARIIEPGIEPICSLTLLNEARTIIDQLQARVIGTGKITTAVHNNDLENALSIEHGRIRVGCKLVLSDPYCNMQLLFPYSCMGINTMVSD